MSYRTKSLFKGEGVKGAGPGGSGGHQKWPRAKMYYQLYILPSCKISDPYLKVKYHTIKNQHYMFW